MKTLLALVILTAACGPNGMTGGTAGGTAGGGSAMGGGTATQTLTVTWSIARPDGSADTCLTGYPKVKVVASAVSNGSRNGDDKTALLDCNTRTTTLTLVTSGDEEDERNADGSIKRYGARAATGKFTITLVTSDASGDVEHQATPTQDVDLSGGPRTVTFVVTPSAAPLSTAWGFQNSAQNNLPSCAAAGVARVRVKTRRILLPDMTPDSASVENVETFACDFEYQPGLANEDCVGCQGIAMSKPLPFGHYATSLEALSASNQVMGTLPYDNNDTVRVERESLVFCRTCGGNASRASVGLAARDFFKVPIR